MYLRPPSTADEWEKPSNAFERIWNLHVLGALDGKHIAMDCPKNSGSREYNYKGYFCTNLLTMCDARYCYTVVAVGQYGSTNDSGVLLNSDIKVELCNLNDKCDKYLSKHFDNYRQSIIFTNENENLIIVIGVCTC